MKMLSSEDHQAVIQCECGQVFIVDPCGEVNLYYDEKANQLKSLCPKCGLKGA